MRTPASDNASHQASRRSRGYSTAFLVIVCVALAVEVTLLVRTNRELRQQLAGSAATIRETAVEIHCGDLFDLPALVTEDGDEVEVLFGSNQPRTLLLIFSSSCRACVETIPIWNAMMSFAGGESIRIVPVILGSEESLPLTTSPLAAPVYMVADGEDAFMQQVRKVPATILLDRYGVVDHAWMG